MKPVVDNEFIRVLADDQNERFSVVLRGVVLSYPKLARPDAFEAGAEERYSATFLLPSPWGGLNELKKLIKSIAKLRLGGKMPTATRMFLKRVEGSSMEGKTGDIESEWFVRAARRADFGRPQLVIGSRRLPKDGAEDEILEHFYPGAVVDALITPWARPNPSPMINAGLDAVRFVEHGERIGGEPVSVDDAFGITTEESDGDDIPF